MTQYDTPNGGFLVSLLHKKHLILRLFIIIGLSIAGLYLAFSLLGSGLSAHPAYPDDEAEVSRRDVYRRALITDTRYADGHIHEYSQWYVSNFETYRRLIDNHFNLLTREIDNQLQIMVLLPPTGGDGAIDFRLNGSIYYNTVRRQEDCTRNLFSKHYSMQIDDPSTSFSLPLSASDYGRYYCIQVGLKVSKPGFDFSPYRVFVIDQPISSPGHGDKLTDCPEFQRTIMQSTYYDYYGNIPEGRSSNPNRENYYRHLNDHFNLYSQQVDGQLNLCIRLPGKQTHPGFDIKKYEIERLEYVVVSQATDCDRPAFKNGVTKYEDPMTEMSLDPGINDYGNFYCLKITLRGERRMSFDRHPYRIFLIPERIMPAEPSPYESPEWLRAKAYN